MSTKPKTIAIAHDLLSFNGSVRVSVDVAQHLYQTMGIRTVFFGINHKEDSYSIPEGSELVLLPDKRGKLFDGANLDCFVREIKAREIRLLLIGSPIRSVPTLLREQTGCQIGYWLHSVPLWETIHEYIPKKEASKRNLLRRLDWIFFSYWKYHALRPLRLKKWNRIYEHLLTEVDWFLTLCPEYKAQLIKDFHLPESQAEKILPMINTLDIAPEVQIKKEKLIVYIGRLNRPDKQVDRLIRIWGRIAPLLPDWRVELYGSGKDEGFFRSQIERNRIERIRLCGYVADPAPIYDRASILCLTSNYEGWGLVLAEAQNRGVIPMAFNVSGGVEQIIGADGRAGRLIVPFDEEAYAEALVELCQSEALRAQLQEACLKKRYDYVRTVNDEQWAYLLSRVFPE